MTDWPEAFAIQNCIDWNTTELIRAQRDVDDRNLKAPSHLNKTVDGKRVAITAEEYRLMRAKDADRHRVNITTLTGRLT